MILGEQLSIRHSRWTILDPCRLPVSTAIRQGAHDSRAQPFARTVAWYPLECLSLNRNGERIEGSEENMTEHYPIFINGEPVETERRETIANPFNGEVVGTAGIAGEADIEAAIETAQRAFSVNRELSTYRRVEVLLEITAGLRRRRTELALLIAQESGKPISLSYGEVDRAITTFTLAAEETKRFGGETVPIDFQPNTEGTACRVERFPIGPIAGITPFNFPLNLTAHKLAPAIAVGSSLVLKPPQQCPLSSSILARIVHEAGAEPGTFNVVHAELPLAERIVTDERFKLLTVTASDRVGWHLKSIAGKKKVVLELGGNAAAIVHEDADLDWAAQRMALGGFLQAGQVCIAVQRVLVHQPVYDRFKEMFLQKVRDLPVGDPMYPATIVGPCIRESEAERIVKWIDEAEKAGARVLCGGAERSGAVVQPTVLESTTEAMQVNRREVFGPVVTLTPYSTFEDALHTVNDSEYGLQAGLFTYDIRRVERAFRTLEVGGVIVNDFPTFRVDNYPYGGVKNSGLGREGVRYSMEEMTEMRALVVNGNA